MRAAILQMCSSDNPGENAETVLAALAEAKAAGADILLTPEVTNCVSQSRAHQAAVLHPQDTDPTLAAVRQAAQEAGLWVLLGSLGLQSGDPDGRFANRSFLISDQGDIAAWYDKIHMFDVNVTETETFRESDGYRPGNRAVVADTPWARFGLSICYDMRFAYLFRDLAKAGAQVLTVPAAFSPVTGKAHWETLLRARAIETGCFVIAPAQTGDHKVSTGKPRQTHGHSLVVAPWGEVLLDAGTEPGLHIIDVDVKEVDKARGRVPSIRHDRPYTLVT
ncbi:carbon-nitrogen hydrolase family protein [Nioella sp. MMSF_3534]|uniref:carbon-nitrogen hydrolase family protein n=1 Tax=Nioella sp. MMSF_3534 TaxID=3046720 RepID=UPI00273E5D59|nr:carbon-nitrogen hydrolase family protein [Nioella sp. MMSF_3534]